MGAGDLPPGGVDTLIFEHMFDIARRAPTLAAHPEL